MRRVHWLLVLAVVAMGIIGCFVRTCDVASPEQTLSREQYVQSQHDWCIAMSERVESVSSGDMKLLWQEAARGWTRLQEGGPYSD